MCEVKIVRTKMACIVQWILFSALFGVSAFYAHESSNDYIALLAFSVLFFLIAIQVWFFRIEIREDALIFRYLFRPSSVIPFSYIEKVELLRHRGFNGIIPVTVVFHSRQVIGKKPKTVNVTNIPITGVRDIFLSIALHSDNVEFNHYAEVVRCGKVN